MNCQITRLLFGRKKKAKKKYKIWLISVTGGLLKGYGVDSDERQEEAVLPLNGQVFCRKRKGRFPPLRNHREKVFLVSLSSSLADGPAVL